MPSLAHEGNPKEDEITITAGSVLSTAQLDIFLIGGAPGVTPADDPESGSQSSSCPDTMQLAEGAVGAIPFYYNDSSSGGAITTFTDQAGLAGGVAPTSTWMNLAFETGTNCCALAYAPVWMVDIPTITYVGQTNPKSQAIYPVHDIEVGIIVQGISDHPYFGVCSFVQDGSTVHDFTGYVLAIDVGHGIAKLMKYVHGDLCSDGQILDVRTSQNFSATNFIWLAVYTDPHHASEGDTIWEIQTDIHDSAGDNIVSSMSYNVHDSLMDVTYTNITTDAHTPIAGVGDRHNRANVGVVAIGGSDLSGIATIGADSTHYGIRAACDSFSFSENELS